MQSTPDQTEMQKDLPLIVLASSSPRRREMLTQAGVKHQVVPASIDDGQLDSGHVQSPEQWVAALAYLKAISSSRIVTDTGIDGQVVVIGADTVCVHDGEIIGQPRDREHARSIILQMSNATHEVLTGVAVLDPAGSRRDIFVDRSVVTVGKISEEEIESYLESKLWKGKAGAYNITERLAAGWPIDFNGDESSIVGLPLSRVLDCVGSFYLD